MQNGIDNRTCTDIYARIGKLLDSINEANIFLFRTGGGVNEEEVIHPIERRFTAQDMVNEMCAKNENSGEIEVLVEIKYKAYPTPVMQNRPSVHPPTPMFSGDGISIEAFLFPSHQVDVSNSLSKEEEEASPVLTTPTTTLSIPVPVPTPTPAPTVLLASSLAIDRSRKSAFSIAPLEEGKKKSRVSSKCLLKRRCIELEEKKADREEGHAKIDVLKSLINEARLISSLLSYLDSVVKLIGGEEVFNDVFVSSNGGISLRALSISSLRKLSFPKASRGHQDHDFFISRPLDNHNNSSYQMVQVLELNSQ
ncbi:hypothetical protein BDA99DRAFT_539494 [Phascolomyces articulosus]|uniref:Uncharacterized protein n=1 Tax=Phascolomyces articulosus TaxID=60185 RepID=A0AAD5JWN1_9FUNG|nr:hypothetical protein BDA99DRAFT_539494 [Phascolomyces articulosus]